MALRFLLLAVFADSAEIQSLFDRLMAADNRGDVDAVVACYADDAVLQPPGGVSIQGVQVIRPRYEKLFTESRLQVRMEVDAIEVNGSLAFSRGVTRGKMIPKDGSPPREIADRYLMVLRHNGEAGWKIAALMWGPITASPP